ncbi:O-methyltransferase [Westerdykella ornata]|uniref:O-methyltransferase n=1 Tax=Westerdykella ornata TaxID=318751 RepID=A0A6A6JCS1_WESOR|nr:O-methyltransferase [Westerdykella ornata]KAF2273798.1 O-methyltransferase [Westerdykella ornata]
MASSNQAIVAKLESILADAKLLGEEDVAARLSLMRKVHDVQQDLELPINLFFKQWSDLTVFTCVDIVVKLGVFEVMKGKDHVTAKEIGEAVGVDPDVIARVMRVLVAARLIASTREDTYSHTSKSLIYVRGAGTAVDSFLLLTLLSKSYITIPEYLKTRPSEDLLDIRKTPYACAYGMEGKTFYETLSAIPEHLEIFNRSMSEPGPEYGIFPFSSLKKEVVANPEIPFVVDIGGGNGQALHYIRKATNNVFGTTSKLILQDRPSVLEQLTPEHKTGIEPMSYDFHTPQPVKGAHVYYLCQILHNYPDHLCRNILKQIAGAMAPHSRLLIVDAVLPAETEIGGGVGMGYLIDIVGLAMGGKERTEKEIAALLDAEGLELVKVWHSKTSWQAAVEARPKV